MSDDLRGHPQVGRETFLQNCCEAVGLTDCCQAWEQQVYFDDLAVSGGSKANAMILNRQVRAERIQLGSNFPASFRIRIIQKPNCRTPDQMPPRPEDVCSNSNRHEGIERLPTRQEHQAESSHNAKAG